MKIYKIYTLSCNQTKDIRYVGCTTRELNQRLSQHLYNSNNLNRFKAPLYKWISSIYRNIKIELLEEVDENLWKNSEQYWIEQFKNWNFNLLNVVNGGSGIILGIRSNSIKSHQKAIDMFTIKGEYIKTFNSAVEACKELKLKSNSSISNVLSEHSIKPASANKRKHFAGGYRWALSGEKPTPLIRFIIDGNIFLSLHEGSKELHFDAHKAKKYLKGLRGPIKGRRIEYDIV